MMGWAHIFLAGASTLANVIRERVIDVKLEEALRDGRLNPEETRG